MVDLCLGQSLGQLGADVDARRPRSDHRNGAAILSQPRFPFHPKTANGPNLELVHAAVRLGVQHGPLEGGEVQVWRPERVVEVPGVALDETVKKLGKL